MGKESIKTPVPEVAGLKCLVGVVWRLISQSYFVALHLFRDQLSTPVAVINMVLQQITPFNLNIKKQEKYN